MIRHPCRKGLNQPAAKNRHLAARAQAYYRSVLLPLPIGLVMYTLRIASPTLSTFPSCILSKRHALVERVP